MKIIDIESAKKNLTHLVEEVVSGEEIILAKAGKPLVRMIPYKAAGAIRRGGQLAGQVWESDNCWSEDPVC